MDRKAALGAEALGTFWLVLGGVGSAALAAEFGPDNRLGIGLVGVSLAFGLTVVTGPTPWATCPAATSTRR